MVVVVWRWGGGDWLPGEQEELGSEPRGQGAAAAMAAARQ